MPHFVYADLAQILFDYLTGARVIYDCPKIAQCRWDNPEEYEYKVAWFPPGTHSK